MKNKYYVVIFERGSVYTTGTLYKTAEEHAKEIAEQDKLGDFKSIKFLGYCAPDGWIERIAV